MSKKKRNDIQALRAIAIIMVLLFHFYPDQFPNGYAGVDMFFVISGYIISMVFPKQVDLKNVAEFYFRRVKRILPLYFAVILTVLLSVLYFGPENFIDVNMASGKNAVLLKSNIVNVQAVELAYDRLIENAEDLLTHCWSLCLEMQWYLIAPFIFLFTSYRIIACEVGFTLSLFHYITTDENTSFNCVFARLWQFFSGIIAFELFRHLNQQSKEVEPLLKEGGEKPDSSILNILSNINIVMLCIGFLPVPQDPTVFRLIVTFATSAILTAGSHFEIPALSSNILSWIGDISYAWYLVHWPIYIVAKRQEDVELSLPLGLLSSLLLAVVVYYCFEKLYLQWERPTVLAFVAAVFSAALFVSCVGTRPQVTLDEMLNKKDNRSVIMAKNIAAGGMQNNTNNMGSTLCTYTEMFDYPTAVPMGRCQMPNGKGRYNILVLGNSYAANQGPTMVYNAFKKLAKKFDVYSVNGCEPMSRYDGCEKLPDYSKLAVEYFKPDILFIMQRIVSGKRKATPIDKSKPIDDDKIFQQYMKYLRIFEKYAKKIYIQQALPSCTTACTTAAVNMMVKENKTLSEIGDVLVKREYGPARVRLAEVATRCINCELIDFFPYFDKASNGKPVPYDLKRDLILLDNRVHFNVFGRERFQPVLDKLASKFTYL